MDIANGELSSTNNQNNTDFTDELDLPNLVDSDEPELRQLDEIEDNKNSTKADFFSVLLSGYGDDGNKLEEGFRLYNIGNQDLAALSDNDLKQFGVLDAGKRRSILEDFAVMINQNDHYDKELNELKVEEYGFDGINNISKHLLSLKLAITGSLLKLRIHPTDDVYVSNETNASELVLKTLEEMKKTLDLIENQFLNISGQKKIVQKTSKKFNCWKFLLVLGATAISSAVVFKYYRTKLFKF